VGSTPNGVFGLKLMWNNLPWVTQRFNALPEFAGMSTAEWFPQVFPDMRPVHIVRRDRVRQAISWLKAAQDGVWVVSGEQPAQPLATPAYDFDVLVGMQRLIVEGEDGWRRLFHDIGVSSCEIVYEELATPDGYEATVHRAAKHVGVNVADITIPNPRSQRQADATNDEWFERYLADEQARQGALLTPASARSWLVLP
jgi:LPS sulfotransferase NodH